MNRLNEIEARAKIERGCPANARELISKPREKRRGVDPAHPAAVEAKDTERSLEGRNVRFVWRRGTCNFI